jgi:uncharacterized repeat protein (TIGR03803 family)
MTRSERSVARFRISPLRLTVAGRMWLPPLVVLLCLASASYGQTTYQVVKGFDAPFIEGGSPYAGVFQAADGSFYGTTYDGGAYGLGTIYKVDAAGTLTRLHSFTGADGANPFAGVIQTTDGNFYGTTFYGGEFGLGTVYRLDAAGTLTTIHSFAGGAAGAYPHAGVIQGTDGNFYGTTYNTNSGGPNDRGTIYRLEAAGAFTTLHVFTGGVDGMNPIAALIQAADGSFYGTTYGGRGTVFKIDASGTLTTLHQFTGPDGSAPYAGVVQATDGSLYGTTLGGGAIGYGTVFRLNASGTLTTLHSFGSDVNSEVPYATLIQATDGSFYGTTVYGDGTVFKIDAAGTLTTLHTFQRVDGNMVQPYGGVIQSADGNFYGTSFRGGRGGAGTVFKLDAAGTLSTVHSFSNLAGVNDGSNPYAPVMQASDGTFYGTTSRGGATDGGTVFRLDGAATFTTLHSFTGGSDGAYPYAGIIQSTDGGLYGTTSTGGVGCCVGPSAAGTVFTLDGAGTLATLTTFGGTDDGFFPLGADPNAVIQATDGSLYGTTYWGGDFNAGTVFTLTTTGSLTVLYSFTGGVDGGGPHAGLMQGADGSFYGTTLYGGEAELGSIFTIDPAGTLTTLHSFAGGNEGAYPYAAVIQSTDGNLYGTTNGGGAFDVGTVFKLDSAGTLTTLHSFTGGSDGSYPYAALIQGTDGSVYGTTSAGGVSGFGTIFKLDSAGTLTTLHSFVGGDGANPLASLMQAADGSFYGTTLQGGPTGGGTVFRLTIGVEPPPPPLAPTIAFGTMPAPTYLGGNFTFSATTTNTESAALTYSAVSGPCAVVDATAGTFSASGAGTCRIEASGAATAHFLAASAQQDIVIGKAAATVTLSNLTQTYTGSSLAPTATTQPAGLAVVWTNASQTNVGSYNVTAMVNDSNYEGSANGTLVIQKAAATVTLSNLTRTYTGNPLTPAAATVPAGLAVVWTNAPQTNAGSYAVTATVSDPNYQGAASGTFIINPPPSVLNVMVLSPNGGEQLVKGVPFTIQWTATGNAAPNPASFDVALSRNGGAFSNIAGCTNVSGALRSCTWTPSNPATDARIRITARDAGGAGVTDTSNGSFVIVSR